MRRSVEPRIAVSRNLGASAPPTRPLTDDERKLAVAAVDELGKRYFVSKNKLMRAVNRATDLKTVLSKQRNVPYSLVEEIADVVGLSASEFLAVSSLSADRAASLTGVIRERELFEPRRPGLVNSSS